MKKMMKKMGAYCCIAALLTLLCLPFAVSAEGMDGIEYPMRRALEDGREAIDDLMPDREDGTVDDRTQGASDGVLDGTTMSEERDSASQSDTASESGSSDVTDKEDGEVSKMSTVAIVIACLAAVGIIILILVAIPKSKSKPGGTSNKKQ